MPAGVKSEAKAKYLQRVQRLFDAYPQAFIIEADNVSSSHMQIVRKLLRPLNSEILMGKNTLIRKALRDHSPKNPKVDVVVPFLKGNVGIIFCKGHLKQVLEVLDRERVAAPAKTGSISPVEVIIPAGNTGLEPTQTAFLQALNIQTKIAKGQIEILKDVTLLKVGQKVGSSEAALLQKLNIKPFTYGLGVKQVYDDGKVYSVEVLKLSEGDILAKFFAGVTRVAAVSLALGWPSVAALPHLLLNGFKRVAAISLATDYDIEQTKELKALLNDPEALKKAQAAAQGAAKPAAGAAAPAAQKAPEPEPAEEEAAMSFDLFD
jgi:large subunit ribosomal protein LP0